MVSTRDGNSCLGITKKWQSENGHLFTSCCHTDDAAAGLRYTGSPENHTYTDRVTVKTTDWISLTRTVTELYLLFV